MENAAHSVCITSMPEGPFHVQKCVPHSVFLCPVPLSPFAPLPTINDSQCHWVPVLDP